MGARAQVVDERGAAVERAELLERCDAAVARALAAGADEAEAFASSHGGTSVQLEKGDLQLARVSMGEALGLRVFVGGRLGFASTNQTASPTALADLAASAVALAKLSPVDPAAGLLAARELSGGPLPGEPALWGLAPAAVVALAGTLMEVCRNFDKRVSVDQGAIRFSRGSSAVVSSRGARAAESDAGLSASLFGMAVDGADVGGFDALSEWTRGAGAFEPALERMGRRFARTVLDNLGAGKATSYRGPVLFAPDAFAELFLGPLVGALSALAVQRGRSALAGKLGTAIAVPHFTLRDAPGDAELAGACLADREGSATANRALVDRGVLGTYLSNARAARLEGLAESTGHAQGGARGVPGIGAHALVVEPGDGGDAKAMAARLGRGLLVGRFSGTVDGTSGDFSGVAKSARWVEGGEVVRSLGETLIAGNAFEALGQLGALSTERETLGGSAKVPWAIADGLNVTAG